MVPGPLRLHPEVVFLLLLVALRQPPLQVRARLQRFTSFSASDVQRLGQLREVLVDVHLLEAAPVSCESLVQRD